MEICSVAADGVQTVFCIKFHFAAAPCVRVAQLDRALGYGPRCREFESSHVRLYLPLRLKRFQGFFLPKNLRIY